jgi:NADH-quinone oxidoreductase subunit J
MITAELIFFVLAAIVVVSALGMILSRNAVFSALFLVLNFAVVALMYMELGAPFIAMAQVTVYAGAIMVLFLFVIMMLGAESLSTKEPLRGQRLAGLLLGVLFIIGATVVVVLRSGPATPLPAPVAGFASPTDIGMTLYNNYALPFEITSVILLVAVVGAIVLTRQERPGQRDQLTRRKE